MYRTNFVAPALMLTVSATLFACTNATSSATSTTPPGTTTGGPEAPAWDTVTTFNASSFELPEGLVVHKGSAFLGLAPLGQIVKVAPDGTKSTYATVPPGGRDGYLTGMAFDAQDNLYVLTTRNSPAATAITPAVYKIPPSTSGGAVTTPFATDPRMGFPNGAAFDAQGGLYVTDSAIGVVFAVSPSGSVSPWATGLALEGSPACPAPLPFPMGANGVVMTPDAAFVTNTAKGLVVRIAINRDGSAGTQTTLLEDCQYVGLDGLARAADGSLWIAQNGAPGRILRLASSGEVTVVLASAPLDGPASIALADDWNGDRVALVTNAAFITAGTEGGAPSPSLLRFGPLP